MSAVSKVMFEIETPWEWTETRSLPTAMEWVEDQVIDHGHLDGFHVTLTMGIVTAEIEDDDDDEEG